MIGTRSGGQSCRTARYLFNLMISLGRYGGNPHNTTWELYAEPINIPPKSELGKEPIDSISLFLLVHSAHFHIQESKKKKN